MATQAEVAVSDCRQHARTLRLLGETPAPDRKPREIATGGRGRLFDFNDSRSNRRPLLDSPLVLGVRRATASLYYQLGIETWLSSRATVISHPKSGRTWLRVELNRAGVPDAHFSHAGSTEEASLTARRLSDGLRWWSNKRILLLIRDPRDTAVSFYFQATRRSRVYSGAFKDFLRDPRFGIERVMQFNLLWLRQRRRFATFIVLSYEDLHADPCAALRKAAEFLTGRDLPKPDIQRAVELCSFEAMHGLETSGAGAVEWGVRLKPGDAADPESFKTRRGVVGGWRDYFSGRDEAYASGLFDRYDYFSEVDAARQGSPTKAGRDVQAPARTPKEPNPR